MTFDVELFRSIVDSCLPFAISFGWAYGMGRFAKRGWVDG